MKQLIGERGVAAATSPSILPEVSVYHTGGVHCRLITKQHQYPNPYKQHMKFPSSLPSNYYPGPMSLSFNIQIWTGVPNMARPMALAWKSYWSTQLQSQTPTLTAGSFLADILIQSYDSLNPLYLMTAEIELIQLKKNQACLGNTFLLDLT